MQELVRAALEYHSGDAKPGAESAEQDCLSNALMQPLLRSAAK